MSSERSKTPAELGNSPGYRAAEAFIRPSPIKTNDTVQKYGFDLRNCTFTLSLSAEKATSEDAPTEIFLPEYHFAASQTKVEISGGKWTISIDDVDGSTMQRLRWWHGEGEQNIKVQGVKRRQGIFMENEVDDGGYLDQCRKMASCNIM